MKYKVALFLLRIVFKIIGKNKRNAAAAMNVRKAIDQLSSLD